MLFKKKQKKSKLRMDAELRQFKDDAGKVTLLARSAKNELSNPNFFTALLSVLQRRCAPLDDTARAVFSRRFRWFAGLSLALAGYATSWLAYDRPVEAAGVGWLALCSGLGASLIYVRLMPQRLELVGQVDPNPPRLPHQPPEILPPPDRED